MTNRCRYNSLLLGVMVALLALLAAGHTFAQETIVIGATVSETGRYADPSGMIREGFLLWQDQINSLGGLLGREVEFLLLDDESDPARVAQLYEHLIDERKVDLVMAPYGTPLTLQASAVSDSRDMMLMVVAAGGREIWEQGYSNVYGMYALGDRFFVGLLDIMAREGFDRVALIYERSSFHETVRDGIREWAPRLGVSVVAEFGFDPGDADMESRIALIPDYDVDGLIVSAYVADGYAALDAMRLGGFRPPVVSLPIAPVQPDFFERAGPIGEGVIAPSQWEPIERIPFPGTAAFIETFVARYGHEPSYHAASAFAACRLVERAVEAVGSLDQGELGRFIGLLDTVTEFGRFKVGPDGSQIGHNPILIQWQDGQKYVIYPRTMRTAPPRF